ncbi:hypothetical protein MMC10_005310 [Thelotrema lepadinum]|nr:hypothetical protein [Thelotrema lepadinum]
MSDEETRLLDGIEEDEDNQHAQFCTLTGVRSSKGSAGTQRQMVNKTSLYERAKAKRASQHITYMFTAALTNTLLLSQIILGAALTALGASQSSHILIATFGALNTIIAGVVTYLKSRGQPMRARMFRDDLERVVDEIENSEVMWLGVTRRMHGYDSIRTDDEVSVRSEVARLTRLYDRALRASALSNPDSYSQQGSSSDGLTVLRARSPPSNLPTAAAPDSSRASDPAPSSVQPDSNHTDAKVASKAKDQELSATAAPSANGGSRTASTDPTTGDSNVNAPNPALVTAPDTSVAADMDEGPVTQEPKAQRPNADATATKKI